MKTIIEMAREADVYCTTRQPTLDAMLERFAALVRADEREECAKVCDVIAQKMDDEGEGPTGNIGWVIDCAEAIRARGNT